MLIGVNILSSLRLGQRYAAHEQLLCTREHGRVFGRLLELYVLNVVFFRSCPHRSTKDPYCSLHAHKIALVIFA